MENVRTVVPWFAVCLLLVISTQAKPAGAPPPQPCLAPLQWEGRIVEYDHGTGRNSRASMSYDGQNQQIRILEQKKGHVPCKKYVKVAYANTIMHACLERHRLSLVYNRILPSKFAFCKTTASLFTAAWCYSCYWGVFPRGATEIREPALHLSCDFGCKYK